RQFDLATGQAKRDFQFPDKPDPAMIPCKELRVTSDGQKVLMMHARWNNGYKTWLTNWDCLTGKCLDHRQVPWDTGSVLTADCTGVLAFDFKAAVVELLDVGTGKPRLQFTTDRANNLGRTEVCDRALSPSGRLMAARVGFFATTKLIDDAI